DGKPLIWCKCEGPLRGGFCWFCASNSKISFNNDLNPNSFNDSQNLFDYSPQPQHETYPCELCGNDSHYGYDCPPQFLFVYEQKPCYHQNHNENYYPNNSPSFLCCDNYEGPHESFQCESMNQNFFAPNSSSFDQYQPLQSFVTQQIPQRLNEVFTTFSNPLFDCNDDFTSSDDESLFNEDVSMEDFKVYSNSLFDDEEINSDEIDPHCFNVEFDLIESLSNHDTLIDSSSKFDYLEELSDELMPTSIVNEERIKREHEEYISLMEKLLDINSFPRPLENFHANTIIETLPTSPIPVGDSDSLREEIDIFTGTHDLLPPSIESDDYDSEGDIYFLEELLSDDSIPLPENESTNFDHHDDPSFPRPPPKPPDVEFFFDFEPNSGELISAVINNIDELNDDECFNP
nr:hypothetical protein [Tanacetum cinerariifolium]